MTDARSVVLERIRAALSPATPESVASQPSEPAEAKAPEPKASRTPELAREYRSAGESAPGSPEVLELLVDRLVDYKAEVHRLAAEEIAASIARLAGATGSAEPRVVVPHGLDPTWLSALQDSGQVLHDAPGAPLTPSDLDRSDAVVTAARVAIAETGTIVLDGGPDQGRRAISLVPDIHFCVVRAAQVVQTVPEAVRHLAAQPRRPLTWISGPSATSDIELNRVEGVHGPRTLHVLLVG